MTKAFEDFRNPKGWSQTLFSKKLQETTKELEFYNFEATSRFKIPQRTRIQFHFWKNLSVVAFIQESLQPLFKKVSLSFSKIQQQQKIKIGVVVSWSVLNVCTKNKKIWEAVGKKHNFQLYFLKDLIFLNTFSWRCQK